jgi:hypothetical protein
MRKNSNIICDSYLTLTAASSHYRDNWICDETLFRLLNAHYPHLKKAFNFTPEGLNRALSAKAGLFIGPNEFGLFFAKIHTECPYSGEKRRVSYFFRQVNGKPPADPVSPLDITDELSKSNSLQRDCMRLSRGGGDPPSDWNTPERGGGDPPSDVNTPERLTLPGPITTAGVVAMGTAIVAMGTAMAAVVAMATAMATTMERWRRRQRGWRRQSGNGGGSAAEAAAARWRRWQSGRGITQAAAERWQRRQHDGGGGSSALAALAAWWQRQQKQHGSSVAKASSAETASAARC